MLSWTPRLLKTTLTWLSSIFILISQTPFLHFPFTRKILQGDELLYKHLLQYRLPQSTAFLPIRFSLPVFLLESSKSVNKYYRVPNPPLVSVHYCFLFTNSQRKKAAEAVVSFVLSRSINIRPSKTGFPVILPVIFFFFKFQKSVLWRSSWKSESR